VKEDRQTDTACYSILYILQDAYNQLNCLLKGNKYWKLYDANYDKWMYKQEEVEEAFSGYFFSTCT